MEEIQGKALFALKTRINNDVTENRFYKVTEVVTMCINP